MPKPNVDIVHGKYVAKAISIARCEHGSIWVRLHDRADNVFAAGCVDVGTAMALDRQLVDNIYSVGGFKCEIMH